MSRAANDGQNCNYGHDDLSRILSVNCGSAWSQTFGYDAFGNLTKSGSASFSANYSPSTNHMTSIGSSTPTYDGDGNVTNDFLHTYAWDAYGRPTTIDGVGVTYDALGRAVEQNRGGSYSQIAYSPLGFKMEIMAGQSVQSAYTPLTGGVSVVYASGDTYYRHPDWLGSSRFTSTQNRTMYSDGAYGPFGDVYAQAGASDESFTGKDQGTVSNLYDFPAREYGIQGRWPSPDPAGVASVDPADPQTWNRYAYVRNNPLGLTDPSGEFMKVYSLPSGNCGAFDIGGDCLIDDGWCDPSTDAFECGFLFDDLGGLGGGGEGGGGGDSGGGQAQAPPKPQTPTCSLVAPTGEYGAAKGVIPRFNSKTAQMLSSALKKLNDQGIVPVITSGYRPPAAQTALRASNSPFVITPARVSWHEAGAAVDFGTSSNVGNFPAIEGAMKTAGFVWGGNFKTPDPVHFQSQPAGTSPSAAMVKACALAQQGG